uniref:Anoctamin transmembrane domain-containing protein n=1 Tax=Chromera velia CCMP2878 TaxID=1169474 RepID=A0A0G4FID4_9ALVE|eukprot:Cvel_17135.t1-p1 / transcript=Cvel_17135.t1 / gene=Cvel_17135 / organism=Chromera_velia_CCMP2878 / gene_product=Anoctamin-7, putative / transcript_product=Anoctamin-7, putative / location=Cvel_scaffold1352:29782-43324(-) / protein_length=1389 / sequence_SO=supercontig / SO=protein_coding / is_pseudo=false
MLTPEKEPEAPPTQKLLPHSSEEEPVEPDVKPALDKYHLLQCFKGVFDAHAVQQEMDGGKTPEEKAKEEESKPKTYDWQYVMVLSNSIPEDGKPVEKQPQITLAKARAIFEESFRGEEVVEKGLSKQEERATLELETFLQAFKALPSAYKKSEARGASVAKVTSPSVGKDTVEKAQPPQLAQPVGAHAAPKPDDDATKDKQAASPSPSPSSRAAVLKVAESLMGDEEFQPNGNEDEVMETAQRVVTEAAVVQSPPAGQGLTVQDESKPPSRPVTPRTPRDMKKDCISEALDLVLPPGSDTKPKLLSGFPYDNQMTAEMKNNPNANRNFNELMLRVIMTKLMFHCQLDVTAIPSDDGEYIFLFIKADTEDVIREAARVNWQTELEANSFDRVGLQPTNQDYMPLRDAFLDLVLRKPAYYKEVKPAIDLIEQTAKDYSALSKEEKQLASVDSFLDWWKSQGSYMVDEVNKRQKREAYRKFLKAMGELDDRAEQLKQDDKATGPEGDALRGEVKALIDSTLQRGEPAHEWLEDFKREQEEKRKKSKKGKPSTDKEQDMIDADTVSLVQPFIKYLRLRVLLPTMKLDEASDVTNMLAKKRSERLKTLWNHLGFDVPPRVYASYERHSALEPHYLRTKVETETDEFDTLFTPAIRLRLVADIIARQMDIPDLIHRKLLVAFFPLERIHKFEDPKLMYSCMSDPRLWTLVTDHQRRLKSWLNDKTIQDALEGQKGQGTSEAVKAYPKKKTAKQNVEFYEEKEAQRKAGFFYLFIGFFRTLVMNLPLDAFRAYYGERVAFYFAFVTFFNWLMIPAGLIGLPVFIAQQILWEEEGLSGDALNGLNIAFAFFMVFWTAYVAFGWYSKEHGYKMRWGMFSLKQSKKPRPEYYGDMKKSPVNDSESEIVFSNVTRRIRMFIGFITVTCIVVASAVVSLYIAELRSAWANEVSDADAKYSDPENHVDYYGIKQQAILIGSILDTASSSVFLMGGGMIATMLVDWYNLKYQTEYESLFAFQTFSIEFVVRFFPFVYTAFFKPQIDGCIQRLPGEGLYGAESLVKPGSSPEPNCADELQKQLLSSYFVKLALNVVELGQPYAMMFVGRFLARMKFRKRRQQQAREAFSEGRDTAPLRSAVKDEKVRLEFAARSGLEKEPYGNGQLDGAFTDYNEVMQQFCYMSLFVVGFPIAPALAFVFFVIETKVDAFKLFHLTRRPTPETAEGIGPWIGILQAVTFLSAIFNAALLAYVTQSLDAVIPGDFPKTGAGLYNQPVERHAAFAFTLLVFLVLLILTFVGLYKTAEKDAIAKERTDLKVDEILGGHPNINKESELVIGDQSLVVSLEDPTVRPVAFGFNKCELKGQQTEEGVLATQAKKVEEKVKQELSKKGQLAKPVGGSTGMV